MKWSTIKIVNDLEKIFQGSVTISLDKTNIQLPSYNYRCRKIFIRENNTSGISICGFNPYIKKLSDKDNPNEEIDFVEVKPIQNNELITRSKGIRDIYYVLIEYFSEMDIIDNIKEYQ